MVATKNKCSFPDLKKSPRETSALSGIEKGPFLWDIVTVTPSLNKEQYGFFVFLSIEKYNFGFDGRRSEELCYPGFMAVFYGWILLCLTFYRHLCVEYSGVISLAVHSWIFRTLVAAKRRAKENSAIGTMANKPG